jgi:hypothetical protein
MSATHVTDPPHLLIDAAVTTLRRAGALSVDFYEDKLCRNAANPSQVENHLSEARAAMMLISNGAIVTMQDAPDLKIVWLGELWYAEVKHILRKRQDVIDEDAMRHASGRMVGPIGDTRRLEGKRPYEQIADIALRKKRQYIDGAVNILIVDSASPSMELMARSAANEYSEQIRKHPQDLALRRLHGIMIINEWTRVTGGFRNVDFALTEPGFGSISRELTLALRAIRLG